MTTNEIVADTAISARTEALREWRKNYMAMNRNSHKATNHAGWEVLDYTHATGWKSVTGPLSTVNAAEKIMSLLPYTETEFCIREALTENTK